MPEINDAIPERRPEPEPRQPAPLVPTCPRCGLTDQVAAVPAVHLAGRSRTTETLPAHDDDPGRTVTRQTTTALSAALAPAPTTRLAPLGALGALAALVAVGTFAVGALTGHWSSDPQQATAARPAPQDSGFWTTGPSGIPMYVEGDLGPLRQLMSPSPEAPTAQHAATSAGSLASLGWISAIALLLAVVLLVGVVRRWLLYRTVTAGHPAAERIWSRAWYCHRCAAVHLPPTVPGAPAQAFTLAEFRMRVWTAGGYGHLARRQPVPRPRCPTSPAVERSVGRQSHYRDRGPKD